MKTPIISISKTRLYSAMAVLTLAFTGVGFSQPASSAAGYSVPASPNAAVWLQAAQSAPDKIAYDNAVTNFILALQQQYSLQAWRGSIAVGSYKVTFAGPGKNRQNWDVTYFDRLIPAATVPKGKLRTHVRTQGAGVAFAGSRLPTAERIAYDPNFPPETGQYCPVTVDIRFANSGETGASEAIVHFINPSNSSQPLSADYSAPVELLLQNAMDDSFVRKAVFNPEGAAGITGLYLLEPYAPGKIPVVLVHGLDSSPRTFTDLYNELRADPVVRQRYQFLLFRYPTGNPILLSGARLRNSLQALKHRYDPKGTDQAFNDMVVIGHSMGGLLTQLQVTDSGNAFWSSRMKTSFGEANLNENEKAVLANAAFFRPLPFIKRVIFISTPHRGSAMADGIAANIANKFIHVPGVAALGQTLSVVNAQAGSGPLGKTGFIPTNGVKNLSPESPFIIALETRPIYAPYHSIIGNQGVMFGNTPGSDGVVPYESSHLAGAQSEFIVPVDHSAQEDPRSIREVDRILRLHLGTL